MLFRSPSLFVGPGGRRSAKSYSVALGGAFYGGFGAVQEAIEHLWVQSAALGLFGRQAVIAPNGFGCGFGKMRQPFMASSCRYNGKTAGACPIDQIANKRGLVAESQ